MCDVSDSQGDLQIISWFLSEKKLSEFNRIYTSLMSSVLSLGIVPERQIESSTAYIYAALELNKSKK